MSSLRLELLDHRLAVLVHAYELLDALLRKVEAGLRGASETDAFLEKSQRFLEAELTALELVDDFGQSTEGCLERWTGRRIGVWAVRSGS